ncbi:MAG TPA: hypothetical protein DCW72_05975 [Elusimicrobia bacterium]|nr:MAG: hypothetical protein A2X30_02880 [Elusimicrobia bacterium GWB2_63_16]HAN04443.1 hypothetical protein [Elusimicrobiota bacterium]HAU89776.1 hypothetical protein [Elusimicrobiota bacterium]
MKPEYYISRYLNVIGLDCGERDLLFSGINGCLDEVPRALGAILASGEHARLRELSPNNLDFLAGRGHITALPPEAELKQFRELAAGLHNSQVKQPSSGGIILLPSYTCNLACGYCFQRNHRQKNFGKIMSPQLVDDIFDKHLPSLLPGISKLSLSLYGGEPFLPANEAVIRRALWHVGKRPVPVVATTNGTTVDAMPDIFGPGRGKVNKTQISLDGWRRTHDRSRVPANGLPTFDKILSNIRLLLDRGTSIDLRLNVDRDKIGDLPGLFDELRAKKIAGNPLTHIYAYPLHEGISRAESPHFMGLAEMAREICDMGLELDCPSTLRATDVRHLYKLTKGVGLTRTACCMQVYQNYLVIDPFGDIYACTEEAGNPELRVGYIGEAGVKFLPQRELYKRRHLENLPDCLRCSVALACGGQCGVQCRLKTGDLFKVKCDDLKSVILDSIKRGYGRDIPQKERPVAPRLA